MEKSHYKRILASDPGNIKARVNLNNLISRLGYIEDNEIEYAIEDIKVRGFTADNIYLLYFISENTEDYLDLFDLHKSTKSKKAKELLIYVLTELYEKYKKQSLSKNLIEILSDEEISLKFISKLFDTSGLATLTIYDASLFYSNMKASLFDPEALPLLFRFFYDVAAFGNNMQKKEISKVCEKMLGEFIRKDIALTMNTITALISSLGIDSEVQDRFLKKNEEKLIKRIEELHGITIEIISKANDIMTYEDYDLFISRVEGMLNFFSVISNTPISDLREANLQIIVYLSNILEQGRSMDILVDIEPFFENVDMPVALSEVINDEDNPITQTFYTPFMYSGYKRRMLSED